MMTHPVPTDNKNAAIMKKRNLLYIGALALSLSMSGCSDSFLDMNNYGAYDDFDSETKVNWYLGGLYYNYD